MDKLRQQDFDRTEKMHQELLRETNTKFEVQTCKEEIDELEIKMSCLNSELKQNVQMTSELQNVIAQLKSEIHMTNKEKSEVT